MLVIGVTGGIGSGKTTVTDAFRERGIQVVDADVIAREVVAEGEPVLELLRERFGEHVLLPNGKLNRAWLRQRIFNDAEAKKFVNQLLHPLIRQRLTEQLTAARTPYVMLSAPLLLENGLDAYCHRVLVVDVDEATQLARTQARDKVPKQQVQQIIAAQISRKERLKKADDVIDNCGTLAELLAQIEPLHQQYLALARQ